MLFNLSLWAGLLLLSVHALPLPRIGIVTLPLNRIEQRSDAHPQIVSTTSFNVSHNSRNHRLHRLINKILTAVTVDMHD